MRKLFVFAMVMALAVAFSPATASASSFAFSFTTPNTNGQGASDVFAFGTLTGIPLGGGVYQATGGNILLGGATTPANGAGTLLPGGPGQTLSPSGYFFFDNNVSPTPGSGNPFLDTNGLLFDVGGTEVNIFSGIYGGSPFLGAGTNTYDLWENNGYNQNGEFNISMNTPEPASLFLLGSGLLGIALFLFQKKKAGVQQQHLA